MLKNVPKPNIPTLSKNSSSRSLGIYLCLNVSSTKVLFDVFIQLIVQKQKEKNIFRLLPYFDKSMLSPKWIENELQKNILFMCSAFLDKKFYWLKKIERKREREKMRFNDQVASLSHLTLLKC